MQDAVPVPGKAGADGARRFRPPAPFGLRSPRGIGGQDLVLIRLGLLPNGNQSVPPPNPIVFNSFSIKGKIPFFLQKLQQKILDFLQKAVFCSFRLAFFNRLILKILKKFLCLLILPF